MWMAEVLLQNNSPGVQFVMLKYLKRYANHYISTIVVAIAWYLASKELLETVFYFFDFQETRESPIMTQNLVIDFLVFVRFP